MSRKEFLVAIDQDKENIPPATNSKPLRKSPSARMPLGEVSFDDDNSLEEAFKKLDLSTDRPSSRKPSFVYLDSQLVTTDTDTNTKIPLQQKKKRSITSNKIKTKKSTNRMVMMR